MADLASESAAEPNRPQGGRFSLRTRLMAMFALGALLLSALLSVLAFSLVRNRLLAERDRGFTNTAYLNASIFRERIPDTVDRDTVEVGEVLADLPTPQRSLVFVFDSSTGQWDSNTTELTASDIPLSLRERVGEDEPVRMRFSTPDDPYLGVGIPLESRNLQYFEMTPLNDLGETLRLLNFGLVGAGTITTAMGSLVGLWATRRILTPLSEVTEAASAITEGQLDTRLPESRDTDLQPLVRSFNGMVERLSYQIDKDARFASEVSHELRSPLMTLVASSAVLEARRDDLPERAQQALDLLVDDVGRFQQLVEDLLEISRFDVGAQKLELDRVNIAELVMQSLGFAAEPDVIVEVDSSVSDLDVRADKRRIVRVMANLIDNARKYADGVETVRVTSGGEDTVHIMVEDDGPGVPEEERQQIFDRFSRGRSAGQRGAGDSGVGLGLSLVREHIKLHRGDVWCEARHEDGTGARFVIELPVHRTKAGVVDEATEPALDEPSEVLA